MKRWMQGLGLVYVLLLFGIFVPGVATGNSVNDIGEVSFLPKKEMEEKEDIKERGVTYIEDVSESSGMQAVKGEAPKIALTFDDGPHAQYTPVLLDGLKERDVKATFFLIGENIEKSGNGEIVKREGEEGHLIGNHTYHHVEITRISDEAAYEEIVNTNELITSLTGKPVEYMRPPFGLWQKKLEERIHVLPVMWTIDPLDWATENVDEIVNKVVTNAKENDIILLHDCYSSSVKAALRIVDLLQDKGFRFVTVDELIVE